MLCYIVTMYRVGSCRIISTCEWFCCIDTTSHRRINSYQFKLFTVLCYRLHKIAITLKRMLTGSALVYVQTFVFRVKHPSEKDPKRSSNHIHTQYYAVQMLTVMTSTRQQSA